jgi:hypothetical protein
MSLSGEQTREMLRAVTIAGPMVVMAGGLFAVSSNDHAASASASASSAADSTVAARTPAATNYAAIANALTQGKGVEITTKLQRCTSPGGVVGPDVVGGLHVNAFQIVPGQGIAFSDTHQTLDSQNASVTEFIRYTVTPDGATTVATTTLSAAGQVESTVQLDCRIGKGAYFHWSAAS